MADGPDFLLEVQSWRLTSMRVLRLIGELDAYTAPTVREKLDAEMLGFNTPSLIVDFTLLTFMASAGVNLMLDLRDEALARRGRLILILPPRGNPRRLFELTRLIEHFEVRESIEEGLATLRTVKSRQTPRDTVGDIP